MKEFDYHGDTNKQLARAMKAFSSSFARANRRKLLRKHFLAFDVNNTRRISRAQFVETVNEVASCRRLLVVVVVVVDVETNAVVDVLVNDFKHFGLSWLWLLLSLLVVSLFET